MPVRDMETNEGQQEGQSHLHAGRSAMDSYGGCVCLSFSPAQEGFVFYSEWKEDTGNFHIVR